MPRKLMSDLKEAFPNVRWKWKSKDENIVVGCCANGLSIDVYRPLDGYIETHASVSLNGELIFDEGEPLVDGKIINEDFFYEDDEYNPRPRVFDPASDVVGFAVGCALFSLVVRNGIPPHSLKSFDPWVQDSLVREIYRRQDGDQEQLQEAKKIVELLEPRIQKAGEALAILRGKH